MSYAVSFPSQSTSLAPTSLKVLGWTVMICVCSCVLLGYGSLDARG